MAGLDNERLSLLFAKRPDIIEGIQHAADTPERIHLFNEITSFVLDECLSTDEPLTKRRRVEHHQPHENGGMLAAPQGVPLVVQQQQTPVPPAGSDGSLLINMANAAAEEVVLLEVKEISVSIPQRKKYDLVFTKNFLYTKQVGTSTPVQGMVYRWDEIEYVFCTPVPEKQQLSYNFTLFPLKTALASTKTSGPVDFEPLLFTVPSTAPKAGIVAGYAAATAAQVSDSYSSLMHWAINSQLQSVGNIHVAVVDTDARVFASATKQPHRPNERAVHVKAFRGSKDGFLFFLPNGVLWGYKKPLLFIPLDRVLSLSYTNVLQRTFNIEIEVDVSNLPPGGAGGGGGGDDSAGTETIEFAMIDQEDYQTIDETYVRRFGLQNRSLAEGRRAKRQLRENAKGAGGAPQDAVNGVQKQPAGGEDMTELERAEQILEEDEEDEEEEDYDPGSEGESEGEGETSEEEDEDGEGEGDSSDEDEDADAEGYDEDAMEEEGYAEDHE